MDTATQFLFGMSSETQTAALVRAGKLSASARVDSDLDGFDETFLQAGSYVGHRIKLSNLYWIYDGLAFRSACKDLYRMVSLDRVSYAVRKECLARLERIAVTCKQ